MAVPAARPPPKPAMLRQQSTAGADDWQLFSNLVPSGDGSTKRLGSHLGEHPADSTGQRWLIGQTALARSDSAKGTLEHQNSHLSMPFRIDRQISGRGWSRPAYAREQSTQLQEPSDVREWMREMKRRQHKMQVRRPHAPVAQNCSPAAVPSHSLSPAPLITPVSVAAHGAHVQHPLTHLRATHGWRPARSHNRSLLPDPP